MKKQTTKKLLAFMIMVMFSFTFVNAQPCNGNKIRVYKCKKGTLPGCNSKCADMNNIPNGWSPYGCPCDARLANERAGGELFTLMFHQIPYQVHRLFLFSWSNVKKFRS